MSSSCVVIVAQLAYGPFRERLRNAVLGDDEAAEFGGLVEHLVAPELRLRRLDDARDVVEPRLPAVIVNWGPLHQFPEEVHDRVGLHPFSDPPGRERDQGRVVGFP